MNNPAFEFLRQYKQVSQATEELVTKTLKRKNPNLTYSELTDIFELGISGEYGKVYSIDPQTLLDWVSEWMSRRQNPSSYLESALLDNTIHITDKRYPTSQSDWEKEVNKCYNAYLRGIKVTEFHPHIYDRLMMDNKIHFNDFLECMSAEELNYYQNGIYEKSNIRLAKQKCIGKYFEHRKTLGHHSIYFNVI